MAASFDPHALKIYTDGSALRNPGGPGGIAAVAEYPDRLYRKNETIFSRGYKRTTNNRMELRACIEALGFIADEARALGISRAILVTDSIYVYENARRAPYWRGGGRTNDAGRPVENADLWRRFLRERARAQVGVRVDLAWIRGKSTAITREVDHAAKRAAKRPTDFDVGYVPGSVARRKTPGRDAATPFPAAGQTEIIRIYRIQPRKASAAWMNKLVFDVFSPATSEYVAVHYAYASSRIEVHRHGSYEATFNDDTRFPCIETLRAVSVESS